MDPLRKKVFAMFKNPIDATTAIQQLETVGFDPAKISALNPKEFQFDIADARFELHTFVRTGAIVGGVVGLVCGLIFGALILHNYYLVFTFGILGLFLGTAIGTLIGIGVPESRINRYARYLGEGGSLVFVRVTDKEQQALARTTLLTAGGFEVASRQETNTLRRIFSRWKSIRRHAQPT